MSCLCAQGPCRFVLTVARHPRALLHRTCRFQVLPAIVSWTREGALLCLHCICSCSAFLPTVFFIAMLICCSACYICSLLATVLLTLVATSPYLWLMTFVSISRYRVPLDLDDSSHIASLSLCSTLNNSIFNCLRNPIAKCSLEALTGTLQMV